MANTVTRTISGRARLVGVPKGRDTDFPRAPTHVTDGAQARVIDINTARKFEFGGHERGKELPERPKTSAGPTSSSSTRKNAEKRETKDDLHFNSLTSHGTEKTFYNFPLPGSLPASGPPPRELPLPPRGSSLGRRTSPAKTPSPNRNPMQAAPAVFPVSTMEIGMALGSPSHQPTHSSPEPMAESITRMVSPDMMDDSMGGLVAPAKPKASRWKFLGGLFGSRKHTEAHSQPFYQLQPEMEPGYTATVTTGAEARLDTAKEDQPSEKRPKSRGRTRTISTRKAKTPKAEIKRANTVPSRFDDLENWPRETPIPEVTLDGHAVDSHQSGEKYNNHILDVDIPSIQMERYSIMFGSVLQKSANAPPSLLARRQATLDKLKTVNEALAVKEKELHEKERHLMPRRATSPQPAKSPGFSLFPITPSMHEAREPSPSRGRDATLQRSNTTPAAISPYVSSFTPGSDNQPRAAIPSGPKANIEYRRNGPKPNSSPKKQEPGPNTNRLLAVPKLNEVDRSWSPDHSHLVLESPGSDIEAGAEDEFTLSPSPMKVHDPAPMKPKLVEPTWDIINKPSEHHQIPPTTASSASGSDHSASTLTSSASASSVSTAGTSHVVSTTDKPSKPNKPSHIPVSSNRPRTATNRSRSKSSPTQVPVASISSGETTKDVDETEQRLKTAADISIARQISVSRQQRQLLVPINKTKTPSSNNLNKKYNQNFPSPASSVNKTASPLGAVAVAASEERERDREGKGTKDRAFNPLVERKVNLIEAVKPNTPTLVVVPGPGRNEMMTAWGGASAVHSTPVGLAERRKAKGAPLMGEIKVGLTVQAREQHRKSERAVVERVGIVSN